MPEARTERYYVQQGRSHDFLVRCQDCRKLVLYAAIVKRGQCRCGNKRFTEVTTLTPWEWLRIRLGFLRFPDWDKFLREFREVSY